MKPLVIMTVYNRKYETMATLTALKDETDLEDIDLVIVDNHSADNTRKALAMWSVLRFGDLHNLILLPENIGCPRALNRAMKHYRQPGQPVVKLDNDVAILTPGWREHFERFLEAAPQVAMVGPWYEELVDENRLKERVLLPTPDEMPSQPMIPVGSRPIGWSGHYYRVFPVIGHMVWHTGWFLDQVGYFDVLADDHLYGFEDLLMCHKAAALGYEMAVLPQVKVGMLQRKNALDVAGLESREAHVGRLRPEYERRVAMIQRGEYVYTDEKGQPTTKGER